MRNTERDSRGRFAPKIKKQTQPLTEKEKEMIEQFLKKEN